MLAHVRFEARIYPRRTLIRTTHGRRIQGVIKKLMPLAGIVIEVVGNWICVTGSTYPVRKELKEAGIFFASKKHAWYYRAEEFKTTGSRKSLDEIRRSEKVHSRQYKKIIQ